MYRFRGRFDYSVDDKGRLNIPSKFRKILTPESEETFAISRSSDGCLWAYPLDEWEKYEDSFLGKPLTKEMNKKLRLMQVSLTESKLDKQGRITLSSHQMKYAGISKSVTLVGRINHIEIWDTERLDNYYAEDDEDIDEIFYDLIDEGE